MEDGGIGEVPSSVSGHQESKKRPNPVVVEGMDEDCGCTTCPKYVCPCPLIQIVIYVIYVAAHSFIVH